MKVPGVNAAFIDSQNINLGVQALGWKLDWRRFRVYLADKYDIGKAYLFVGYIAQNQQMYTVLQEQGFILIFKPVLPSKSGEHKGNVDADLVLRAMIELPNYERAIVATSDGDFYSLVEYLYQQGKLEVVLSPASYRCSALLKKTAKERIHFLDSLREKLEYKARK